MSVCLSGTHRRCIAKAERMKQFFVFRHTSYLHIIILHNVIRVFEYFQNNDSSLWNLVLNAELNRLFSVDPRQFCQLSSAVASLSH